MSESINKMKHPNLIPLTIQIVSACITKNSRPTSEIPDLIRSIHRVLSGLGEPKENLPEPLVPAVPIKKSVTPDALICLEDGKKLKMLKRHLMSAYDMTPDEYRFKWALPSDYPMVAPNYAEKRSQIAREIGLGRKHARK